MTITHAVRFSFTTLQFGLFYKKCIALFTVEKGHCLFKVFPPPTPSLKPIHHHSKKTSVG